MNPYGYNAEELSEELAIQMYNDIRDCDTDVSDITKNLGFRVDNIKIIKDHIFYNEHMLDRHPGEVESKRFDPYLLQAIAWRRLQLGIHTV